MNPFLEFLDERIAAILECPPMWGSLEAIEAMIITLLDVRAVHLNAEAMAENPRRILELYIREVARELGSGSPNPLHVRTPSEKVFVPHMRAIVAQVILQM